jgi:hypothetical protein
MATFTDVNAMLSPDEHDRELRQAIVATRCELCRGTMKLDCRQPHLGRHPELLTFRCQQCGYVVTVAAEEER